MFHRNRRIDKNEEDVIKVPTIIPKGNLIHLSVDSIKPNPNNPRRLFDPSPLRELKESIREHGVLVPITAYKLPGQELYSILDGERRYRCCKELIDEGINISVPANIVDAPDKMASLLYMFNIHAFREQWELMPTALSLQEVINTLDVKDNDDLHEITGLSQPQIERCKKILSFDKSFQELSLISDPIKRIPSNFWVELYPVLEKVKETIPALYEDLGRDTITQKMVDKYKSKKIKSVIHFRRILEAFEIQEGNKEGNEAVGDKLRDFILSPDMEIRKGFDVFIRDPTKLNQATTTCDRFISELSKLKLDFAIEGKKDIAEKLRQVINYTQILLDNLQGDEPPSEENPEESL